MFLRGLKTNTYVSKILVHIPLSIMENGLSKAKKGFPKITFKDNFSTKKKGVLKLIPLLYMYVFDNLLLILSLSPLA